MGQLESSTASAMGSPARVDRQVATWQSGSLGRPAPQRSLLPIVPIRVLPFTYNRQPKKAPAFDTLVGKLLDIRVALLDHGGRQAQGCQHVKTTKRTAKCQSTLPWGAVRIKYARTRFEYDSNRSSRLCP